MKLRVLLLFVLLVPCRLAAAEDPLAAAGQLLLGGRAAEARAQAEKVRQVSIAAGNPSGEAVADLLLAMVDVALKNPDEARTELENSRVKFTAAGDPFGAWLSLWIVAGLEAGEARFDAAIAVHERMLALLREASASDQRFSAESVKALAVVFGMPPEATAMFVTSPEMFKPILLRFAEAMSHDAYGAVLMETGALDKADEHLSRAAELSTLFFGLFDGPIDIHIGDLRRRQWRFDDARKHYQKALDGIKTLPNASIRDGWVQVEIAGKLASLEMLSGRLDEALAWNDRALALVRASPMPSREASILSDRADLLSHAGRYRDAKTVFAQALQIATKNHDDRQRAYILGGLGALHLYEGAYGTAASQYEQALELYQKLDEPLVEGPVWIGLAEVYLLLDERDSSHIALDKARELAKKSGFKGAGAMAELLDAMRKTGPGQPIPAEALEAFGVWCNSPEARELLPGSDPMRGVREIVAANFGAPATDPAPVENTTFPILRAMMPMLKGRFLYERGDLSGARTAFQAALSLNPSRDHQAGLLALIGVTYWREGNLHDATEYLEKSAKTLDAVASDVKVEEMLAGYLGSSRRVYYDILIEALLRQGRVNEAFEQSERARARAFLQVIGNHRVNAERSGDAALVREAEILRTQIARWEKGANQAPPLEAVRIDSDLRFARQQYRSVMTRIKASNPEYAALTSVEPLPLDEIRAALPGDTTLISYFVSAMGVHAWVVDQATLHHVALPLDVASLNRVVCWASHFAPAREIRGAQRTSSRCGDAATPEEAFAALFAPLREHVHNARLIVVPHGVLHYVPFAALRDGGSKRYLVEDYTLSYIPSASALRFLRSKETPLARRALVLGNPNSALPVAGELPGAKEEAVTVAHHLGVNAVLGAEARESLLYGLGGKVDLLHIAAHAIYDPVNPLFSRIALAPGDGQDGNVEVHEILSTLDLSGVNLVVLSACETAVGERSGGDEIVGLTRALLYAGTPGVISTLWNIDDAGAARLMDEFYRRLAGGELAADALRNAQLAVSRSERYGDPRYWAAFTLTGNPQGRWTAAQ